MTTRNRRMSDSDIKTIIDELDRWALGQLGSKLSWSILEDSCGFSRQSLQAKSEIKAAFDYAKSELRGGLVKTKEQEASENDELRCKVSRLEIELDNYKKKELLWLQRWQRIAFNIRLKGMQVVDIDKEVPLGGENLTERDTGNILRPFDKKIPPTGRI